MTLSSPARSGFADPDIRRLRGPDHAAARAAFRWPALGALNIAELCCARWARVAPERTALLAVDPEGRARIWRYRALDQAANALAAALRGLGVSRGDRLAVLLPQSPEALLTHLAGYKLGAVVTPLFAPFGPDAIAHRLADSGARLIVTDAAGLDKLAQIPADIPALCVDGRRDAAAAGARLTADSFWATLERGRDAGQSAPTRADDPAFLAYTSGTTGPAKGALHGHRTLIGHLPAVQLWTDGLGDGPGAPAPEVVWTPSDWAWLGGLCNLLLPSLFYGAAVVCAPPTRPFDPERALGWIARFGVSLAFLPPTALRMMRAAGVHAASGGRLRAIGAAGEPLGAALGAWAEEALGAPVNEFYGQTECNGVVGWSRRLGAPRPGQPNYGATGRAVPGFDVAVRTEDGAVRRAGASSGPVAGELIVAAPTPSLMLEYFGRPEATEARFWRPDGDPGARWLLTGDRARIDADGTVRFEGRADDVINAAGYRIGPAEIEDCLVEDPAVAQAAAVAAPDPIRGQIVVAAIVRRSPTPDAAALAERLTRRVKARLGAYAAPRRVLFVDALPQTETGKVRRAEIRKALDPSPGA